MEGSLNTAVHARADGRSVPDLPCHGIPKMVLIIIIDTSNYRWQNFPVLKLECYFLLPLVVMLRKRFCSFQIYIFLTKLARCAIFS